MVIVEGSRPVAINILFPFEQAVLVLKTFFRFRSELAKKWATFFNNRERAPNCSVRFPYN
jgi:hypothetical protein